MSSPQSNAPLISYLTPHEWSFCRFFGGLRGFLQSPSNGRGLQSAPGEYVARLQQLRAEAPELLVPHAYTRWGAGAAGGGGGVQY